MIKPYFKKTKQALRSINLYMKGHLIPFLGIYWDKCELAAAQAGKGKMMDAATVEGRFLAMSGVPSGSVAIATSSGRTALEMGLRVLKAANPDKSEVLIPSYSCKGLLDPILNAGLTPVLSDIGHNLNMSRDTVKQSLSAKTLAVVPVHLGGRYVTDLPEIAEMAESVGATLIEDVCQATGGQTNGIAWGSQAPIAIYSFALGKNLTATAGGLLISSIHQEALQRERAQLVPESDDMARQRLSYIEGTYYPPSQTFLQAIQPAEMPKEAFMDSYHYSAISTVDARLLSCQLDKLAAIIEHRRRHAEILRQSLLDHPSLKIVGADLPTVWTKFTVKAQDEASARQVRGRLKKAGIETEPMYVPLHLRDCGRPFARAALPVCEDLYRRVFNLPIRPSLHPEQLEYMVKIIRKLT